MWEPVSKNPNNKQKYFVNFQYYFWHDLLYFYVHVYMRVRQGLEAQGGLKCNCVAKTNLAAPRLACCLSTSQVLDFRCALSPAHDPLFFHSCWQLNFIFIFFHEILLVTYIKIVLHICEWIVELIVQEYGKQIWKVHFLFSLWLNFTWQVILCIYFNKQTFLKKLFGFRFLLYYIFYYISDEVEQDALYIHNLIVIVL